jgi:hypothetical protein
MKNPTEKKKRKNKQKIQRNFFKGKKKKESEPEWNQNLNIRAENRTVKAAFGIHKNPESNTNSKPNKKVNK